MLYSHAYCLEIHYLGLCEYTVSLRASSHSAESNHGEAKYLMLEGHQMMGG